MKPTALFKYLLHYPFIYFCAISTTLATKIEPAQNNISVNETENGIPIINIAAPNQAGISHNIYHQFNIGEQGAMLNNIVVPQTERQSAGQLPHNPHLVAQPAETIINEVISSSPSVLKGNLTVVGYPANVIVANPYGITCDGCGFIHTPHVTLTTGQPMFDERRQFTGLDVTQGAIMINRRGIDARDNDSLSLISRVIKIDSRVDAKDLYVIIGKNQVNTNRFIVNRSSKNNLALRAVDSTALGGMYADYIRLISTEKGVGINLANLNTTGNIEIDVRGQMTLNTMKSERTTNVAGDKLQLTGRHYALKNMVFTSRGDCLIDNAMLRIADDTMEISAIGRLVTHASRFTAGKRTAEQVAEEGEISLSGNNLFIHSTNASASIISLQSPNSITQQDTSQLFARELHLSGQQLNLHGHLTATDNLALRGHNLQASKTATISSENKLHVLLSGDGLLAGEIMAGNNLSIEAKKLANKGTLQTAKNLSILADYLTSHGPLEGDNLHLTGEQWDNYGKTKIINTISTNQLKVMNNQGQLNIGELATLNIQQLNNSGEITAQHLILVGKKLLNGGTLLGTENLNLSLSDSIYNNGKLVAPANSQFTTAKSNNLKL